MISVRYRAREVNLYFLTHANITKLGPKLSPIAVQGHCCGVHDTYSDAVTNATVFLNNITGISVSTIIDGM